jgi:hypothetical protein
LLFLLPRTEEVHPPLMFAAREGVVLAVVVLIAQNRRSTPPTRVCSEGGGRCRCCHLEQKEYTPCSCLWQGRGSSLLTRTEVHPLLMFAVRGGGVGGHRHCLEEKYTPQLMREGGHHHGRRGGRRARVWNKGGRHHRSCLEQYEKALHSCLQ